MQRFYLPALIPARSLTIGEDGFVHQISRVLRSVSGDTVVLFNGDGREYVYSIDTIAKREISLVLTDTKENTVDPERHIRLCQALPNKYDKIEWIIQKWIEIGIRSFLFFSSDRSQRLVINEKKIARFHEIAREALEQSGGNAFPGIVFTDRRGIPEVSSDASLALHTKTEGSITVSELSVDRIGRKVDVFVGPEWGWSDAEIDSFRKNGVTIVHASGRIMRTETAGAVVAFYLLQTFAS